MPKNQCIMSITLNIWRIPAILICNYFTHSFVQILFVNNKSMVILVLAEAKRAGGWCWAWMHQGIYPNDPLEVDATSPQHEPSRIWTQALSEENKRIYHSTIIIKSQSPSPPPQSPAFLPHTK